MNKPNFASRNHAIFSSCDAGAGKGGGSCVSAGGFGAAHIAQLPHFICLVQQQPTAKTATSDRERSSAKVRASLVFMVCVQKVLTCAIAESHKNNSPSPRQTRRGPGL